MVESMEILVDGEVPDEFVGCEGRSFCSVRTLLSPGPRVLTATAVVFDAAVDPVSYSTLSESITVEVAASELSDSSAQGCRVGGDEMPVWALVGGLFGVLRGRRKRQTARGKPKA